MRRKRLKGVSIFLILVILFVAVGLETITLAVQPSAVLPHFYAGAGNSLGAQSANAGREMLLSFSSYVVSHASSEDGYLEEAALHCGFFALSSEDSILFCMQGREEPAFLEHIDILSVSPRA